jgi:hypothetical protein
MTIFTLNPPWFQASDEVDQGLGSTNSNQFHPPASGHSPDPTRHGHVTDRRDSFDPIPEAAAKA